MFKHIGKLIKLQQISWTNMRKFSLANTIKLNIIVLTQLN